MIRPIAWMLVLAAQLPIGTSAATCAGADTAIARAAVEHVIHTRYLNFYHVAVTVTNVGTQTQSGSVLQFADMAQYGIRLDDRGIPPLAAGQSYTAHYVWKRSNDAGAGTTTLDFHVRFVSPNPPGAEDCNRSNDYASVTF